MAHRRAQLALVALTSLLLAAAAVAGYARSQLADERAFSARATSALDDPSVRSVVAERVVDGIVQSSPDALTVRPLLTAGVAALAGTPTFRAVFRLAVRDAHGAIISGRASVVMDLDRAGALLLDALRSVSPRAARQIPPDVAPRIADLEPADRELSAARFINDLADWWWPLLAAALLAGAGCALLAGSAREATIRLGSALALAGALVAAVVTGAGVVLVESAVSAADIDDDRERDALQALWSAMFGDLRTAGILAALCGILVAATASGALAANRREGAVRRVRDLAASPSRGARLARAAILIVLGAALLLEPGLAGRAMLVGAGLLLIVLGVGELSGGAPGVDPEPAGRGRAAPRLAAAIAAVVVATVVAVALVVPAPSIAPAKDAGVAGACNGSRALCDRRLNAVVFPATHNSYSAADEPGWLFANQRRGIARQLQDGIRAFLIDIHFGFADPDGGGVRTDIEYEGASRNKVAAALSPEALETADRLVGRVGLGNTTGRRRAYLCHTLCELGSEPLDEQMAIFSRFLDRNPGEVVVLFIEPYVPVEEIERSLESTGLLPQAAELRREEPLPTLGELVADDKRLIVFTEENGGERPWYLDGFSFIQDTPLGAVTADAAGCTRFRGTPDSPMLLLNHWDTEFPPVPSRNRRIGGAVLERRMQECGRRRGLPANLPAVDFYELTDVVAIAKRANADGR